MATSRTRGPCRNRCRSPIGPIATLDEALEHLRARRLGEGGKLNERVVGIGGRTVGPDADQHDPLET